MFKRWLPPPRRSALLLGPRRAGKSTYLRGTFPDFIYLTLDDLDVLDLAERDPKALFVGHRRLIIDEIQRVPRLTVAAKYAIDAEGATVLMSGSSRIGLLDTTADSMAGRIDLVEMPPACWGESDGDPTHAIFEDEAPAGQLRVATRAWESFLRYGGFPEVVSQPNPQDKEAILRNYKNTYFTRDLSLLSNIEDVTALRAVLHYYAQSIGAVIQVTNVQREANISHITAKKYLHSIYQSGLGFTLVGYQYGPAKRYIKGAKAYFCDTGMITAIEAQCNRGQLVESFVIAEIEKRRKLGFYRTDQLYYYKSSAGAEIDLILEEIGHVKAIEIKATPRPGPKDVQMLQEFVAADPRHRRGFLFYTGTEYRTMGTVRCLPIAAIYRGR